MTFSARKAKVTIEEARRAAETILGSWVETKLDGILIDMVIAEMRAK